MIGEASLRSYDDIPDFGLLYDSVPIYAMRADVQFYVDEATAAGGPVLELGCGTGRILLPTARAGCVITGLDSSTQMLERCRAKVGDAPDSVRRRIRLTQGDIRAFDLGEQFALITAPFRVVQHLTSIDDQMRFLAAVAKHLAPGGRLVFDVFNPSFQALVAADGAEREDTPELQLADGRSLRRTARVRRVRWIDQISEIELAYYIKEANGLETRHVHQFDMRWYLRAELEHLLARSGFRVESTFGDFDRTPLSDGCRELIVRAEQ